MFNADAVEIIDGICDCEVVNTGTSIAFGVNHDECASIVHGSNMSKFGPDGMPIKDRYGKVIKGPNYYKANPRIEAHLGELITTKPPYDTKAIVRKELLNVLSKYFPKFFDQDRQMTKTTLTDGSPVPEDESHKKLKPNGQQEGYVVLSEEERAKGFVRPVRYAYIHDKCGSETVMCYALAETYARDPYFYSGTFCCQCGAHFPVGEDGEFKWLDGTRVGT